MSDATEILSRIEASDPRASEQLLTLVYDELRCLAAAKLARERPGHTLQPTALVHEAYLRLINTDQQPEWNSRRHFFAAAAEAMRRILVENARSKGRQKRGGGRRRVEGDLAEVSAESPSDDLLALDEALHHLAALDPAKARLVELRFFAGLTNEEAAAALDISSATAKRHWRYARAWLHREVNKG